MTEPEQEPTASKDPLVRLLDNLGHQFTNDRLLMQALTHRSYVNEVSDPQVADNERFEFLGDAVIDLVVSTALMERFPEAREGRLSKIRASVVSEGALARLARDMGLGEALRLGRGELMSGGRDKPSILSDAFEALIAAVYLDAGLARVAEVLLPRLRFPDNEALRRGDPKTELQQRVQADRHMTPTYHLVAEAGPDHDKTFEVELRVGEDVLARGAGRTKKEAEQRAAAVALDALEADEVIGIS
ncbi:MAG: ribonuclease III [Deltaproteobacteria bacterium]|nr:ribonuclease III [Deltaproteobacteria bacterium]